jgi:molecular chaperone HtpG
MVTDYQIKIDKEAKSILLIKVLNDFGRSVEKYINQAAFFWRRILRKNTKDLAKKSSGIIGHFGLGFYLGFYGCRKVLITKS